MIVFRYVLAISWYEDEPIIQGYLTIPGHKTSQLEINRLNEFVERWREIDGVMVEDIDPDYDYKKESNKFRIKQKFLQSLREEKLKKILS